MPRGLPIDYANRPDLICANLKLLGAFRTGTDKNTKLQIDNEGVFTRRTGFWSFKGRGDDDSLLSDFTIGSLKSLFDFAYKCMSEPKNKGKLNRALYLKAFSGLSCLGDYYRGRENYTKFDDLKKRIKTKIVVKLLQIVKTNTLDAGWFPSFGRVSTQNNAYQRSAASLETFGQSSFKTDKGGMCFGISLDWCRRVVVKKNYSFFNSRKVTTQLPLSNKDRLTKKGLRQAVIQLLQFKYLNDDNKFQEILNEQRSRVTELNKILIDKQILVGNNVLNLAYRNLTPDEIKQHQDALAESEALIRECQSPDYLKLHLDKINFAHGDGVETFVKDCKFECKDADEFKAPLTNLISPRLDQAAIQAFMLIFKGETVGHAMAFAKDETGFIGMDPNFGEFKCPNKEDLVFIFSVLLSSYNLDQNITKLEVAKVSPKPGTLLDN